MIDRPIEELKDLIEADRHNAEPLVFSNAMIAAAPTYASAFFSADSPVHPSFPQAYEKLRTVLGVPVGLANLTGAAPYSMTRAQLDDLATDAIRASITPPSEQTVMEFRCLVLWVFGRAESSAALFVKAAPDDRSERPATLNPGFVPS